MKEINFNDRIFQYDVVRSDIFSDYTDFYEGTVEVKYKKYLLFGPEIVKQEPNMIFTLYFDVENAFYSKDQVRAAIEKKLKKIERIDEINKGEII